MIKINILLFPLDQMGNMFLICVDQRFPSFLLFVRSTLLKKSYFPIINTSVAILNIVWMKTLLWYILFSFSER